jgi:hypothetical protein
MKYFILGLNLCPRSQVLEFQSEQNGVLPHLRSFPLVLKHKSKIKKRKQTAGHMREGEEAADLRDEKKETTSMRARGGRPCGPRPRGRPRTRS